MNDFYFDEGSRLAAATRTAREKYRALDRCGFTVSRRAREEALEEIEAAEAAEAAFWNRNVDAEAAARPA